MNKVLSKKIGPVLLDKLKGCGYFTKEDAPVITGSIPEDKRGFLIRSRASSTWGEEEEVPSISDVLDWLRETKDILVVVDVYLDPEEGPVYCGKIVKINFMSCKLDYSSSDYESTLYSTISKALEELC